MRILSPVVEIAALPVLDIRQKRALGHTVAFQFIGYDHARHILQALQQSFEEALGRFAITPSLNQDVEHDAILIHRTPQIMKSALNADKNLVAVTLVARPGTPTTKTLRETLAEFLTPTMNRLVGDEHASCARMSSTSRKLKLKTRRHG
jgi:hypothetical protein